MADIKKTIDIIFGAVDNVTPELSNIESSINRFDAGIQGIASPIAAVTEKVLALEAAVITVGAAFLGFSVNEAVKFQSAQADLAKVLSDTDPAIGTFTGRVDDLSVAFGESATNVLAGIANFKQAGFSASDASKLIEDALKLVVAGDIEASEATEQLISQLKGFGESADNATRFVDVLNEVSNNYATSVGQLGSGMAKISPIASKMGFTFEETAGLITPIIEVFRSGDEAARGLRTGLLNLTSDNKRVTDALDALGVSQKDLNGNMRSGKDIFNDVAKAFQGLSDEQKIVFTQQLAGKDQAAKLAIAFTNLNLSAEITATAMGAAGSAGKEVAVRLATAEVQLNRAGAAFDNLARSVGVELLDGFGGVIGSVTDIELAFKQIVDSGGLAPLFDALRPKFAEFQSLLADVAENLPEAFGQIDFSRLLDSFDGLAEEIGQVFENLFGEIDLSTPEGLADALQKVVDGITALTNVTTGIVSEFQPIFAAIGEIISRTGDAGAESQKLAGEFLGIAKLVTDFGTALGGLAFFVKEFEADIKNVSDVIGGGFIVAVNLLQTAFDGVVLIIVDGAKLIVDTFEAITPDFIGDPWKKIGADLQLVSDAVSANFNRNFDELAGGVQKLGQGLSLIDRAPDQFIKLDTAVKDSAGTLQTAADQSVDLTAAMSDVGRAFADAGFTIDETTGIVTQSAEGFDDVAQASSEASESLRGTEGDWASNAAAILGNQDAQRGWIKTVEDGIVTYRKAPGAIDSASKALDKNTQSAKENEKALALAAKQAQEVKLKLLELASDQRIALIEANVKINTANIEAETDRIKSAFESIGTGIESTGEVISSALGALSSVEGFFGLEKLEVIQDQLKNENKLREQELDTQRELIDAQIELIRARADSLSRGDPVITVQADGLAPQLELIFTEILKLAQIRANEEGLELLLGAGA